MLSGRSSAALLSGCAIPCCHFLFVLVVWVVFAVGGGLMWVYAFEVLQPVDAALFLHTLFSGLCSCSSASSFYVSSQACSSSVGHCCAPPLAVEVIIVGECRISVPCARCGALLILPALKCLLSLSIVLAQLWNHRQSKVNWVAGPRPPEDPSHLGHRCTGEEGFSSRTFNEVTARTKVRTHRRPSSLPSRTHSLEAPVCT
jgi:hypothetical protein